MFSLSIFEVSTRCPNWGRAGFELYQLESIETSNHAVKHTKFQTYWLSNFKSMHEMLGGAAQSIKVCRLHYPYWSLAETSNYMQNMIDQIQQSP
ncbi:hypothetical protein L6164_001883 [Bauhinia variegata]|uniref:Uncharacterized protein n=1 Tax=Bauhinia variegata TaxID=167791 RepID=A0ACB9QAS5_BAUVA|nr:hypothetical protein L6164_001883 [Bauhinia variegata]